MKKPRDGTEQPKGFAVEIGTSWKHWVKHRTDDELEEITVRLGDLGDLQETFGKPHSHAGIGLRRLTSVFFEFRISRGIRVVFALIKPRTIRLIMTGNHDEVRAWLKENI
jgi:hypothetical protein